MQYNSPVMKSVFLKKKSPLPEVIKLKPRHDFWLSIREEIPHKPGVYIYSDLGGKILYVGKAIDLYHRVGSYFAGRPDSPKTAALVERIAGCRTIVVASELEALILEANLIKKYRPPYNIKLTDDKDYLYIKITRAPFPQILTARKKELIDAKEYFGPFPSSRVVRTTLKKLRCVFPWCSNPPKEAANNRQQTGNRPCFFYHIKLCPGACAGKISRQEYAKIIHRFSRFMSGEKNELIGDLTEEMEEAAEKLQFEKAQQLKKIIFDLQYLTSTNNAQAYLENPNFLQDQNNQSLSQLKEQLDLKAWPGRIEAYDISNLLGAQAVGSLVVLSEGDIDKKWYRKFRIRAEGRPNDVAMMREVIRRRARHKEWPTPDLILVDGGRGQVRGVKEELESSGWNVPVFGLAKRLEWLYGPDTEIIRLPKKDLSLRLLQKIRDEAHRFAVNYHRKLRENSSFSIIKG